MIEYIKQLYKFAPHLLGTGYNNCLQYLSLLIGFEKIIDIPSGTKLETWEVPQEWVAKEAWVKDKCGNKIIEWKNDLTLLVYSQPFKGKVNLTELKKHLYVSAERPTEIPYNFSFYEPKWGFCISKGQLDNLQEEEYEVFIDVEFKPGTLKIGVHTIKGKSDREILLFAHLDHPYQANDNLSGVVCLTDLAPRLRNKFEHTIKIIFCPETIGSIAYALTQDISKVDFMIAIDICGNDNIPTLHWSFDGENRINRIAHLAMMMGDESFNMNRFRATIGSDEYVFNDPKIGIPGLLLTRFPYPEYHTADDTPEIIKEDKIKTIQKYIENIIDIYEHDYIPKRKFKAPLFRSKYGTQTPVKSINMQLDYLIYNIDGEKWLSEIIDSCELNWQFSYDLLEKLHKDNLIEKKYENNRHNACKKRKQPAEK